MSRVLRVLFILLVTAAPAVAQVTGPPHVFTAGTVINPDEVNLNFSTVYNAALNRGGGTMTGNLLFSADNTHDIGASGATRPRDLFLGRNAAIGGTLTVTGASTFSGGVGATTFTGAISGTTMTLSNTGASSLDIGGGLNAGTGNVAIIGTDGRIPSISSTTFASLSGANLTSIPETAITDGSILARVASTETISGSWTFSSPPNVSIAGEAFYTATNTSTGDDWKWSVTGGGDYEVVEIGVATWLQIAKTTGLATFNGGLRTPKARNITTADGEQTITLNADDYMLRISSGGTATDDKIIGFTGGTAGRRLTVCNVGVPTANGTLNLRFNDTSATAGDRITYQDVSPGESDAPVTSRCIPVVYDGTSSRWRIE